MRVYRVLCAVLAAALALPIGLGAVGPLSPDAASVQIQLGGLLFGEGRYAEALAAYQRAARTDDPGLLRAARSGLIRSALRVAEFRLAGEAAAALKRAWPSDPEVVALYSDSRWALGLFDEAEASYEAVLAADPANTRGRHGLARALASRNRLEEALAEARSAVTSAPGDAEAHYTAGYILERLRRYDEAAASLANCINLLPNKDLSENAAWARAQVKFLRNFGDREPYAMAPGDRGRRHSVPIRLDHDKVIVRTRINGNRETFDFTLDTGAETTVISRPLARRLGVVPVVRTMSAGVGDVGFRGLDLGMLDSLEIGSFKVRNLPVIIKNPALSGLPSPESEGFSPLALGLAMSVDYKRRLLTIGPGAADEPADFELPLRLHRLATVRGLVDSTHAANFVVDTGGEVISISAATARSLTKIRESRRIALKVYGTSGWDRDAYLLPGVDLEFEALKFRNMPVVVLNLGAPSALLGYQLGGIVGHNFLSRYRFDIDLERSVLRLRAL